MPVPAAVPLWSLYRGPRSQAGRATGKGTGKVGGGGGMERSLWEGRKAVVQLNRRVTSSRGRVRSEKK
jgi:hypothetical protein